MSKTLLYRIFGLGRVPKRMLPAIRREGIVLLEEGIGGSLTFRDFRAPGRRYSRKWSWFTGSLVLTGKRFAAFTCYPFFNPIINVSLDDERLAKLRCSLDGEAKLCVLFDPSAFHEGWSGTIECRFATPKARLFLERIQGEERGVS
jgi:hypothetical protein